MAPAREPGTMVVEVQGIPTEVEIRGAGRPILLVHGWSADRGYMIADLEPVLSVVPGWALVRDWLERLELSSAW